MWIVKETDPSKQTHDWIFIGGEKPAKAQSYEQIDLTKLDFSNIAALHLIVTSFKGEILLYDFMQEIKPLLVSGFNQASRILVLRKDKESRLSAIKGGNL